MATIEVASEGRAKTCIRPRNIEMSMPVNDPRPESIMQLRERVKAGSMTIEQIRRAVAARIEAQKSLNAFITMMIEDAEQVDVCLPLAGVPVGIKDFFDTAGVRTTAGFSHFANRVPTEDAALVRKLKAAGAMIVGKTNMHRLGMGTTSLDSYFGPVQNPWMPDHVAGGSSGGSAAAVAAGICFATIDTDAIGSARLPAACCSVTGFKPSFDVLARDGILRGEQADPIILKLSHAAIIARSAEDAETVFSLLADGSLEPAISSPRLGIADKYAASEVIRQSFEELLPSITPLAASTRVVAVPFAEAQFDLVDIDAARANINARLFSNIDLLVLPTLTAAVPTLEEAKKAGDQAVSPANTFFANYFGLPAITIPLGFDRQGGSLAIQIVGRRGADLTVLGFAKCVQRVFPPILAGRPTI